MLASPYHYGPELLDSEFCKEALTENYAGCKKGAISCFCKFEVCSLQGKERQIIPFTGPAVSIQNLSLSSAMDDFLPSTLLVDGNP